MSFTNPATTWLLDPTTDSPYSHSDLADWLHLSPCTSSLQDISSRINNSPLPDFQAFGAVAAQSIISPSHPQILAREPNALLPTLCYTPSPTLVGLDLTEINDGNSRLIPLAMSLSSSSPTCSPFTTSQESYDLKVSPLASLFCFRDPVRALDSDASPVIRGSQEHFSPPMLPRPKERKNLNSKRLKRMLRKQSRTLTFDNLASTNQVMPSPSSSPGPSRMLLSPYKLATNEPGTSKSDQPSAMPKTDLGRLGLGGNTVPSISLRTLSGPDSPSAIKTTLLKRPRDEDLELMVPSKRQRLDVSTSQAGKPGEASFSQLSAHSNAPKVPIYTNRNFPASVEISPSFSLVYRRFPASSYFSPLDQDSPCDLFHVSYPGGAYNPPRDAFDLYTPRFVKGRGADKVGLCPICIEPFERGGQQKKVWLAMKVSAFKCYHLQYFHGISAASGHPFSPPLAFRTVARKNPAKTERKDMKQGKCHKCSKWIAVEGVRDVECKVKEIYWWKHAASCHNQTSIPGESGFWEEDAVFKKLSEL